MDAGIELAATKHRITVGFHGQIAGLHLQNRFGQADISPHDDGQGFVIVLVNGVADVGSGGIEGLDLALHFDRLVYCADSQRDVLAYGLGAHYLDAGAKRGLEAGMVDRYGIGTQNQGGVVKAPASLVERTVSTPVPSLCTLTDAPTTLEPVGSVTIPVMMPRSARCA